MCEHCDNTGIEPFETSEYPPEPCSVCGGHNYAVYEQQHAKVDTGAGTTK